MKKKKNTYPVWQGPALLGRRRRSVERKGMARKNKKVNSVNIITGLFCLLIAATMFNFGIIFTKNVLNDLHENCKTCSFFDKNCPYTDKELLEQEYGGNAYCMDMGIYEMKFKIGSGAFFGISTTSLIIAIMLFWQEYNF